MALPLPPDPYKALGVPKEAAVTEIKSAYRKLVLKCHPDKVQDPTLKAQKQEEFQKVQQAYELLTDEAKRTEYDEKIKVAAFRDTLRSQPSRSGTYTAPSPKGPSVFEYEVRTAEPRSSRYKSSRAPSPVRVHTHSRPSSYEDDVASRMFESASRSARKTATYEERKKGSSRDEERRSSKDEERRRRAEEERERERWEKEMKKQHLSASKKSRDKERKKGSEEKTSRKAAFIVDEGDSEDGYRPRFDRKPSRKSDEKISSEKASMDDIMVTERTRKQHLHKETAAQYIQAAKMKAQVPELEGRPRPLQRAETFQVPPYATRYPAAPQPYVEEEEYPRRSSGRPNPRRTSDQVPSSRTRESPRTSNGTEPYIVTAEPPSSRKPTLQTHSSAPPIVSEPRERKEPQRAQTLQSDYMRRGSAAVPPPLPRASTFNEKTSRPSRLNHTINYSSPSSDSSDEEAPYIPPPAPRYPSPPPPPRQREKPISPKRYIINEKGRSVPVVRTSHRKAMRDDAYDPRDRSESPRGTSIRVPERAPFGSGGSSSLRPASSRTPYYADDPPIPISLPLRPGVSKRDAGGRAAGSGHGGSYFGEVNYAPRYSPEDVNYGEHYRPRTDAPRADYYQPSPRKGEVGYA